MLTRPNPNPNPKPNPNPSLSPSPSPYPNPNPHQAHYHTAVELFYAHGLRQSAETLRSTGFSVHQDTEDFAFIEYTVLVKLTPDAAGAPPSAMRVVGAARPFAYDPAAGAAGCFKP